MAEKSPFLIEKNLLNNQWLKARDGATLDVYNPANGKIIGTIPKMSSSEAAEAIDAAHAAQAKWAWINPYERGKILRTWFDLIVKNKEELAKLMTLESGKPLAESRAEMDYGASFVEWYAEEAKRMYGQTIPSNNTGRDIITIKQPIGVAAMITPWNFPNSMITRKAAPAFAAGCTVILKPDHRTPYSALALGQLALEAGFPEGVFNIVTGDAAEIGQVFTSSPLVRKISFTGSTPVGKLLMEQAASTVKKISLELGGNAPFIVFESVDPDLAITGLLQAKIRNSGQTCICPNRIYVQDKIHDAFVEKLKQAVGDLKIGDGFGEGVRVGPLIDQRGFDKVQRLVSRAIASGAKVILGGEPHELGGTFFQPTILTGITAEMDISCEEIFGPVIAIQKFRDESEVLQLANDTDYGLASYVFTHDLQQAQRVMKALEYGMVGVNTALISFAAAPFGGVKQSGLGREGGIEGIQEYLETKYIALQS
jgi:succinate-semialdehyde dehydrogenase/glutarate-semialdehyde dehydrogenase